MFKRIRKLLVSALVPAVLFAASLSGTAITAFGAQTDPLSVSIPVKVTVSGSNVPADKEYKLVIEGLDNAPMPESSALAVKNGESASFGPIQYTVPADYRYRIRQTTEADNDYTYDNAVFTVTVQVVNSENGGLSANIVAGKEGTADKMETIQFSNTYAPTGGGGDTGDGGGGGSSSGGGGGGRTDLTTITDQGTPTAQIGEDEVPLSDGGIIDQILDTLVPLAVLPKTGDASLTYGLLLAVLVISGSLAGGIWWKRKKSKGAAE